MKLYLSLLLVFTIGINGFSQTDKWIEYAEQFSDAAFEQKTEVFATELAEHKLLESIKRWKADEQLSGEALYNEISHWNTYPDFKETGLVIEQSIQLDTHYSVPYYIYIPQNYKPHLPSKLLVYYKGGWIGRDSFPANVAKEIVIDNPTFSYLDQYNVIEIFPALRNDLAIYGWYGYKQLRKMLAQTKQILNIDDNQVYLAGFSDGGRTTYNIAYLTPSAFAAFYTINGVFNNISMNYANFSNRKMTSFVAKKDELAYYKTAIAIAQEAHQFEADWSVNVLDEGHFYFPYQQEILPKVFDQMNNSYRNPFPNKIVYHKDYDFDELTGIDWLHIKSNTEKTAEQWHYTSEISIPSSDTTQDTLVYGEKTAQVVATYFNNTFDIKASLVDEVEIYISPLMVDMNYPIKVIVNEKEVFNQTIGFDKDFILSEFAKKFDRKQLWVNKIELELR